MHTNRKLSVMLSVLTTFAALAPVPGCAPADEEPVRDGEAEAVQVWGFLAAAAAACVRMPACRKLAGETAEEIMNFLREKGVEAAIDWLKENGVLPIDQLDPYDPRKKKKPTPAAKKEDCKEGDTYTWSLRLDTITRCLVKSTGAVRCQGAKQHDDCAGTHEHGYRFRTAWTGTKCKTEKTDAVRCLGALPAPSGECSGNVYECLNYPRTEGVAQKR